MNHYIQLLDGRIFEYYGSLFSLFLFGCVSAVISSFLPLTRRSITPSGGDE
jgi:hypothetical protein